MTRFRGKRQTNIYRILETGLTLAELFAWIESLPAEERPSWRDLSKLEEAFNDIVSYGSSAVDALIEHLLPSENDRARWIAIRALAEIGDPRAVHPLWELYQRNQDMRAFGALATLQDPRLFDAAVAILNEVSLHRKTIAIHALGSLGDRRAVALLQPLLRHPDHSLRHSAFVGLFNLLIMLDDDKADDVRLLTELLYQPNTELSNTCEDGHRRCQMVVTLSFIDHPDARAALVEATSHPQRCVRRRARKALADLHIAIPPP